MDVLPFTLSILLLWCVVLGLMFSIVIFVMLMLAWLYRLAFAWTNTFLTPCDAKGWRKSCNR